MKIKFSETGKSRLGELFFLLLGLVLLYFWLVDPWIAGHTVVCPKGTGPQRAKLWSIFPSQETKYDTNNDGWICSFSELIKEEGLTRTYDVYYYDNYGTRAFTAETATNQPRTGQEVQATPSTKILLTDDFSGPACSWQTLSDSSVESQCTNGLYSFEVNVSGYTYVVIPKNPDSYTDFLYSASVKPIKGTPGIFGLVYRYRDSDNYYFFAVRSDGYYSLIKNDSGSFSLLTDWVKSEAFNPEFNYQNKLGLMAVGHEFYFSINGELLGSFYDESFSEGYVGFAVGTFPEQEDGTTVHFDDVAVLGIDNLK